jgi:hypothetical protein
MSNIKKSWLVCGDITDIEFDEKTQAPKEFTSVKAAISRAKLMVQTTENTEAWIYVLSHVVSRPTSDPIIDVVK